MRAPPLNEILFAVAYANRYGFLSRGHHWRTSPS